MKLPFDVDMSNAKYSVSISNTALMLSGIVDIIITDRKGVSYPVHCSLRLSKRSKSASLLAGVYHELMRAEGFRVNGMGLVVGMDNGRIICVDLTRYKFDIAQTIEEMRSHLLHEVMPPAPMHRGKCVQCSFVRFCADIFRIVAFLFFS